jgi:hypothetical protein
MDPRVMTRTMLASFRFPQRLTRAEGKPASGEPFTGQDLIDFLKIDPSYFHQSFRKKFKPKPLGAESDDIVTGEPQRVRVLDVVSTTRSAQDLLAATAALADFHHLITREHIDSWEAIEPDFPSWRRFPGAYVLWTAKIVAPAAPSPGANQPARLRVVRQPVANAQALDSVSRTLGLLPDISIEDETMVIGYFARGKQRPGMTVEP